MKLPAKHSNYVNRAGKHKTKKRESAEESRIGVVRTPFFPHSCAYTHTLCGKFAKRRRVRNTMDTSQMDKNEASQWSK